MRKIKNNNFASILSSLIMIMLVVFIVGFLIFRTDGLTTTYKQFYLICGTDNIVGDRDNMPIIFDKEYKFEVINNIDGIKHTDSKYSVTIKPYTTETTDFVFNANGSEVKYSEVASLTNCFNLKIYDGYFTLKVSDDLPDMLKDLYSTNNITNCPSVIDTKIPYFKLVVTSIDTMDEININLSIKSE